MSIGSSKRPVYVDDNGTVRQIDIGKNVKLIGTDKDGNLVADDAASVTTSIINYIYPVGSVYITVGSSLPSVIASMGTWEQLATGTTLWNVSPTSSKLGKTIPAGLPNITGTFNARLSDKGVPEGGEANGVVFADSRFTAYQSDKSSAKNCGVKYTIDASVGNPIYGNSSTVQPPAIGVTMWKRVR
jgi:hypothetical protein